LMQSIMQEIQLQVTVYSSDVGPVVGEAFSNFINLRKKYPGTTVHLVKSKRQENQEREQKDPSISTIILRGHYTNVFAVCNEIHLLAPQGVGDTQLECLLQRWKLPRIYGPGGENLRNIKTECRGKVWIELPTREDNSSSIYLTGNRKNVEKFYQLMLDSVLQSENQQINQSQHDEEFEETEGGDNRGNRVAPEDQGEEQPQQFQPEEESNEERPQQSKLNARGSNRGRGGNQGYNSRNYYNNNNNGYYGYSSNYGQYNSNYNDGSYGNTYNDRTSTTDDSTMKPRRGRNNNYRAKQ